MSNAARVSSVFFAVCGASFLHAAEPATTRPNILWVVSEDNTFNYVGAYVPR